MEEWEFVKRFMWWRRRKLSPDEANLLAMEFLHSFSIDPKSSLNGGEIFVLLRSFIDRYGRTKNV